MRAIERGMSIVELMIGVLIVSILLTIAAPNFMAWIQNSQIRTMTESIQSGLQHARTEAVRLNTPVSFALVDGLTSSCALSTTGTSWVVFFGKPGSPTSANTPVGNCANAPVVQADPTQAYPQFLQVRDGKEGTKNALVTMGQNPVTAYPSIVTFDALGRLAPTSTVTVNVTHVKGCTYDSSGSQRCLRVTVSPSGQVRMCDPDPTLASITPRDPRAC